MRKIISAILVLSLFLSCSSVVSAHDNSYNMLVENQIAQMQENEKESILSDENLTKIIKSGEFTIKNESVEISCIEPINISNSLSNSSEENNLFKATTVFFMPGEKGITKLTNNLNSIRSGDQENYRSDTDDTSSIRGYISVFFRYVILGGNEFIDLESVSGGYQVLDSSVSIRAQSVYIAQNGRTYEDGYKTQTTDRGVSGTSWALTPSRNWLPVQTGAAGTFGGANYTFTMKRTSSNYWSHTVYNSVESNPIG